MSHTPRIEIKDITVGVVGLPLAEAFARHLKVIGFQRNQEAVDSLNRTVEGDFLATTEPGISWCGRHLPPGGHPVGTAIDQGPGRHERR